MAKKRLAVVVPMYNIQDFLKEALNSLLKQGLSAEEMQVILIDDGSEDNTFKIAQEYVKKHPKMFEAYSFANAGLGAARNRGTRLANAEYITYVDPDDIVVENSYLKALDILNETGSDILIGGTKRFNSKKIWNSAIHSKSVIHNKFKTSLKESPELIWDSTSWNKIYKLDFMRKNNFYFPEGMLYEDLPTVTPAIATAKSVDVMADTMYLWRVRDFGAPSITQLSSNDTSAILDRLKANASVLNSLNEMQYDQLVIDAQAAKFLNFDTLMMFRKDKYDLFTPEQKQELFVALKTYLQLFSSKQIANSKFEGQVYFNKVLRTDNQKEFDALTLSFLRNEFNYYGEWIDGSYTLRSDSSDITKVATADDFTVHTKVQSVSFDEKNLNLEGYVFAEYSDMSTMDYIQNAKISVIDNQNNIISDDAGTISFFENKGVTAKFGYNKSHFVKDGADFNYDYSGYEVKLPLTVLSHQVEYLNIQLSFDIDGQSVTTIIGKPIAGDIVRPKTKVTKDLEAAFDITYDQTDWSLQVKPTLDIAILSYENEQYRIQNAYQNVYLQQGKTKLALHQFENQLLLPKTVQERLSVYEKEARGDWRFITAEGGVTKPVYFAQEPINLPHETFFRVLSAKSGQASMEIIWYYPKVAKAVVENDVLTLDFELFGWEQEATTVKVIADPQTPEIIWDTEKVSEHRYRLTLPLTLDGFGEKEWLNFQIAMTFIDGYETTQTLKWGDHTFELEGQTISANQVGWEFRRVVRNNGGFAIKRTADRVYRLEDGAFERFLETEYSTWLNEPILDDHIMMSSYWGRDNMFNDNPEALYRHVVENYPNMTSVIMLKDAIRSYPEYSNAKVVSYGTKEYWYYLAKSKYFVNNVNYTEEQRDKRPGQIEVQTMHGTPLKTLGFEVLSDWTDAKYNAIHRKNLNWNYLVTPSDWVAEYAKKVFDVNPKVLTSGYPRNDKLFNEYSDEDINNLKITLNVPQDKKIIAYTPTWHDKGATNIANYLDVEAFYNAIPNDTFVILKSHHFEPWIGLNDKYSDKFRYADESATIEDLYIVSDALITDYSSVMFDYVLLKKPMIFYAFDYSTYLEGRGLNFDFREEAPGPFVETQNELHKWLVNYEQIPDRFANKISMFERKFVQYDTGNASEYVIDTILKGNHNDN